MLYKLETIDTKINVLEGKLSDSPHINEDINIQLPIALIEDLQLFEEQLQEQKFENHVVNILYL